MNLKALAFIVLICLFTTGCREMLVVSNEKFQEAFSSYEESDLVRWSYAGSGEDYHFLVYAGKGVERYYQVPKTELILNEHPFSANPIKWKPVPFAPGNVNDQ